MVSDKSLYSARSARPALGGRLGNTSVMGELESSILKYTLSLHVLTHGRLQSLPELLQFSATEPEYLQDHLRWVLRGHRLDVVELLRFPAIKTVLNASPSEVGTLPDDITRLAREYLDNAVLRIDIHVEEFLHRHQGTWLTIRGCTRSILALIGMKLKCQQVAEHVVGLPDGRQGSHTHDPSFQSRLLPKNWRTAVVRVDDMLFAWETESTDVARLRLIVQTLLGLCYEDRDSD